MSSPTENRPTHLDEDQVLGVDASEDGLRLDRFLKGRFPGLGRASAARLIGQGAFWLERPGRRPAIARKGILVSAGDRLRISPGSMDALAAEAEGAQDLPPVPREVWGVVVVHQDSHLLVFAKPAGVPTHPLRPGETGTLANHVAALFGPPLDLGGPLREAGLVHRLDTLTSGLILAARTPEAYAHLRAQFAEHRVEKTYLALVWGTPPQDGTVDAPIESRRGRRKVAVDRGGQRAETRFRTLEIFAFRDSIGPCALVEANTSFGRRHQVRAHLAHAGYPLCADPLYGSLPSPPLPPGSWPLLFASALSLVHPQDGSPLSICLPLPPHVRGALDDLR